MEDLGWLILAALCVAAGVVLLVVIDIGEWALTLVQCPWCGYKRRVIMSSGPKWVRCRKCRKRWFAQ